MSESTSVGDVEEEYADIEGVYVDDDGNPRPETEALSKSGGSEDE